MKALAEVIGLFLIGMALYIGWVHIVKRWIDGPPQKGNEK